MIMYDTIMCELSDHEDCKQGHPHCIVQCKYMYKYNTYIRLLRSVT